MSTARRRPYAYLRRSNAGAGKAHGNGAVSFDMQRAAVLEMAAKRGDPEPELIVEWGVSGADRATGFGGTGRGGRRKAYHELRAAIEADQVSALYAYSLSRLARSTRVVLDLVELCVAHGTPIRLAKEGDVDGTTPAGRLYLTVLAAVATMEAELAAERSHDRNAQMREAGRYIGRPAFGWTIDPDTGLLVEKTDEAPIVARILALYAELKSSRKVARALNAAGVPSPEGGVRGWGDGTVRRILARQPGYQPPATVQGSRAVPVATFARLVVCSCGSRMTPVRKYYTSAAGEPRTWIGYTCMAARFRPDHPKAQSIPEAALLAAARAEAAHLATPAEVQMATDAEAERAALEARRAIILDGLESGLYTKAEATERLAMNASKIAAIDAAKDVVKVPAIDWTWPPETLNPVLTALWDRIELTTVTRPAVKRNKKPGMTRQHDELVVGGPNAFVWRVPEWRA
jgi:DNA invertase Pin-like site-specific DNA recombinase